MPFYSGCRICQGAHHPLSLRHIGHRKTQHRRRVPQCIFPLEKTGHQIMPGVFHQITRDFTVSFLHSAIIVHPCRYIFTTVAIGKQRVPVRDTLFAKIESGGRQHFARKSFDRFLLPKLVDKGETGIRFMADTCKIDIIVLHLHVKLRPPYHAVHTGINGSDRSAFFRCVYLHESRIIRQRISLLAGVNDFFYQFFLEAQRHEIGREIASKEITVRHRVDYYLFSFVIEGFRRIE